MNTELMLSQENQVALNHQIDIYKGASMLVVTKEEQATLTAAFERHLVEIRPDGIIYLPQVFWRGRLNETFGTGQWCIVVKSQSKDPNRSKLYIEGVLMIRGHYVSTGVGEAEYVETNANQSWASVWEAAKSDCITRCCKDLGIAAELWQPEFIRKWIDEFAVKVFVTDKNGKAKVAWRKKTSPPFWNENPSRDKQPQQSEGNQASGKNPGASAYNHKSLEQSGKPLISNEQFKKACDRLRAGELEVYGKTVEAFSLTEAQLNAMNDIKTHLPQAQQTKQTETNPASDSLSRVVAVWSAKVDKCQTIEALTELYQKNQLTIEANEEIKHLFTARKLELQKK
jgi:hypothetical protein